MATILTFIFVLFPLLANAQLSWEKLKDSITSAGPEPRRDCAIGYDKASNKVYIFGGRGSSVLDDTWSFYLTSNTWKKENTSGSPGKRFSVVSGLWNNGFYVSTGQRGSTFFDDIWRLDLTTLVWDKLPSGSTKPEKRYGSAGGFYQDSSFFYLTHGFSGQRYSNTFRYDVSKKEGWEKVFKGTNSYNPNYPHARCLHSAAMIGEHELVMYGGCMGGGGTGGPCPADDSWRFDASNDKWERLPHCASPRTYSSMALLPLDQDADNKSIIRAVLYGGVETSRSVIAVEKAEPDEVVIFNAESNDWSKKWINTSVPAKRSGAAMVTVQNGIIMFGGAASNGYQNDVWLLKGSSKMADETTDGEGCNLLYFTFIELHGIFMFIGWGVLLQLGMFFARYFRHKHPWWFKMHRVFQVSGLVVAVIGFCFAVVSVPFDHFKFAHGGLGLFIMLVGLFQPINAFFRPHKTDQPPTTKRKIWEIFHKNAGRLALLLALINISLGVFLAVVPRGAWIIWFVLFALWVTAVVIMEIRLQLSRYKSAQENISHVEMTQ